ncbi:immediate early response gene 2 protein [Anolis carolinensis]|uniref:immediate early response gene 2 protein n=1 Tax=Anolis carolinensis TaxID=28377 RepID=UPI002F2B3DDF
MMEVQKEAQRIMTMSVWKMYHSRMQRGGLRLHRSLQLSLVMRSARDLYLSAKLEDDDEAMVNANANVNEGLDEAPPPSPFPPPPEADPEPMDTQPAAAEEAAERRPESAPPARAAKPSRKRRSSSLGKLGAAEAGLAPSKKARLAEEQRQEEEEQEGQPQRQEGPFPSLARVLQGRFSAPPEPAKDEPPANCCRPQGEGVLSIMVRAVVAF